MESPSLIALSAVSLVQGIAEMFPVSSSSHIMLVAHILGWGPRSESMSMFLIFSNGVTAIVIAQTFYKEWMRSISKNTWKAIIVSTLVCALGGLTLKRILEHFLGEDFFFIPSIHALLLCLTALLNVYAGLLFTPSSSAGVGLRKWSWQQALILGLAQALCVPCRGLSRLGVTYVTSKMLGLNSHESILMSFATALCLAPVALGGGVLLSVLKVWPHQPLGVWWELYGSWMTQDFTLLASSIIMLTAGCFGIYYFLRWQSAQLYFGLAMYMLVFAGFSFWLG